MSGSRRENAYVNFDLHKKNSFLYFLYRLFVNVFCSALLKIVWEQIFHFQTILGRKCDWKRDMLRKKCFLMSFQGHPRSIKVIWVYYFFCIPIGYHVVKIDENMKCLNALNLAIWAHLAPQWVDMKYHLSTRWLLLLLCDFQYKQIFYIFFFEIRETK